MILVDTSIWVDHLRAGEARLARLLERGMVLSHPWVIGELALGNLSPGSEVLRLLQGLPEAVVASDAEVLILMGQERLAGVGIGYVDAQLLAAARLTPGAQLWTGERRLAAVAARLKLGFEPLEEGHSADAEPLG
ncbi:MAG: type II toxin-antitoxin system VapC family toxin [Candidatus Dormibacteria bacterium]